jgi:Flp pilus assembly protein TadD
VRAGLPVALGLATLVAAILPALVLASQTRLDKSLDAFAGNDCATAVRDAKRSSDVLGSRAQPWQVVGLCAARAHQYDASLAAFHRGLEKDPDNWRLHAWTAATQAAAGRDPSTELAIARRLNPREASTAALAVSLERADRDRRPVAGRRYLRDYGVPER